MTIVDRVTADMKEAMKNKDRESLETLRLIRAEFLNKQKEKGEQEIPDSLAMEILQKMVKSRKDAIRQFREGNREDLAEKDEKQIDIIQHYLPEEASDEEIKVSIREAIAKTGAATQKDLGKVMGFVMKDLKQKGKPVDGAKVRNLATQELIKSGEEETE